MVPLPPYARRVEYLEGTGTQWIDTGYAPTASTRVEMAGLFSPGRDPAVFIRFGSRYSATQSCLAFNSNGTDGNLRFDLGTGSTSRDVQWQAGADTATRVVIDANTKYAAYVTDTGTLVEHTFTSNMTFADALPLTVFAFNANPLSSVAWQMRVSSLKIWNNGSPVRSFVPCRILDVGYLWDEVEGKFYGNSGTVDFVLGPDVREGVVPTPLNPFGVGRRQERIRRVEYLESTGTQYIDTGILPTPTMRLDLDFMPQDYGVRAFGADDLRGDVNRKFWVAVGGRGTNLNYNASTDGSNIVISNGGASILNIRTAISVEGKSITAFGSTQTDSSWTIATDNGCSIGLFAGHRILDDGSEVWFVPATMRLYSCAIYDDTTLVRDFVPVAIGSVGYLLDRVSGQLFGKSGTGDFVLGPDIVPVEYVESTGGQYVNTRLTITQGSIAFSFEDTGTNTNAAFLGQQTSNPRLLGWIINNSDAYVDLGASSTRVDFDSEMPSMIIPKTAFSANTGSGYVPLYLFTSRNANGARTPYAKARCRYCQFWDSNDALVRSYVPVRVGTEGALYDRVTDAVFRSATSTPLVAGPETPA